MYEQKIYNPCLKTILILFVFLLDLLYTLKGIGENCVLFTIFVIIIFIVM